MSAPSRMTHPHLPHGEDHLAAADLDLKLLPGRAPMPLLSTAATPASVAMPRGSSPDAMPMRRLGIEPDESNTPRSFSPNYIKGVFMNPIPELVPLAQAAAPLRHPRFPRCA